MKLTKIQEKYLRTLAQEREPVVLIGQKGLTESITDEIDRALDYHELVKIRIRGADRELRGNIITRLCRQCRSVAIQKIGGTVTLYRRNPDKPVITLPP